MDKPTYLWRKLTPKQREGLMTWRKRQGLPWHRPPHRASEKTRYLRNDAHFWATMNYVHHNPVHHGYAPRWQDWPFSSATDYLAQVGHAEAVRVWEDYPVLDYGKGWDDPEL